MRRRTRNWLFISVGGLICGWAIVGYLATNVVVGNHPHVRPLIASPEQFGLFAETVHFLSADGIPLTAWWIPASGSPRGSVILAHGRDGNRSHMLPRAAFLVKNGYNAILVDLRNHGESGGNYMTPGYLEALDILGALDWLRQRGDRGPVVALGHSYGAVAALHAGAQSPEIAAVIADGAFISTQDMMSRAASVVGQDPSTSLWMRLGVRLAAARPLELAVLPMYYLRTGVHIDSRRADALAAINALGSRPVLFIAGENDRIAPAENARRMCKADTSPRKALLVVPGAGHNNTFRQDPQQYEAAVLDFLSRVIHSNKS